MLDLVVTTYLTHDNGGRPFKVVIEANNKVTVVKNEDEIEDEDGVTIEIPVEEEILSIDNPFEILIGKSPECDMTNFSGGVGEEFDGNAILIRPTEDFEYIIVGVAIEKFKTDSKVLHFVSPVGNNDVPYTYAITSSKIYLLSENAVIDITEMSKELLDQFIEGSQDPYTFFYGHETVETFPNESEDMVSTVICEQL